MDVKKIFLATLFVPTLVKRFIIISAELDGTNHKRQSCIVEVLFLNWSRVSTRQP
jgi:hypothetical protein